MANLGFNPRLGYETPKCPSLLFRCTACTGSEKQTYLEALRDILG